MGRARRCAAPSGELRRMRRPEVVWATGPPWSSVLWSLSERAATSRCCRMRWISARHGRSLLSPFEAGTAAVWLSSMDRRTAPRLLRDARAVTFFYAAEAECFWRMYNGALDASPDPHHSRTASTATSRTLHGPAERDVDHPVYGHARRLRLRRRSSRRWLSCSRWRTRRVPAR